MKGKENKFIVTKINRIKELTKLLNDARNEYYNYSTSVMSDFEYDILFDELLKLEKETGFALTNSPTLTVGYEVKSELNKKTHNHLMLSLDKTKSVDTVKRFRGDKPILTMLKMDGLTVSLRYVDGRLVSAETRGDGTEGEDVTHNAKVFENIPHKIHHEGELIVDGEAIITYEDFDKINSRLSEEEKYKNPRNLASGSVRQFDSSIAAQRHIQFVAWKLVNGYDSNSFSQRLNYLEELGFTVVPYLNCFDEKHIEFLKMIARKYSYPIDGLVVSFDEVSYLNSLGATNHHIKGQLAYKFYDQGVVTRLLDIEWNTCRTGIVSPTAIFEPVEIDGSIVSRATLHNLTYIKKLQLGIGDEIHVVKQNSITPAILENLTCSNSYKMPIVCQVCGTVLNIHSDNESETLHCPNEKCPSRFLNKFVHFVSKDSMNIQRLSKATLEKLISMGWLHEFSDIYTLDQHQNDIKTMDGFGPKSWERLWDSIQKSRTVTFDRFLVSLGIPSVGKATAKTISNVFPDWITLTNAITQGYDLSQLQDIGESTAQAIVSWLMDEENANTARNLLGYVSVISKEESTSVPNELFGKNVAVTGALKNYTRTSIQEELERLGAKMACSISQSTDYLLTNAASGSSKYKKAIELNIPIINEEEFERMRK